MLIKAELCQVGLINQRDGGLPKCAQCKIKLSHPLRVAERYVEYLFEVQPEFCWHLFKCLQWTLIIALRVTGFQTKLGLNYL